MAQERTGKYAEAKEGGLGQGHGRSQGGVCRPQWETRVPRDLTGGQSCKAEPGLHWGSGGRWALRWLCIGPWPPGAQVGRVWPGFAQPAPPASRHPMCAAPPPRPSAWACG